VRPFFLFDVGHADFLLFVLFSGGKDYGVLRVLLSFESWEVSFLLVGAR